MNDEGIINKEYRQEILQKAITHYGEPAQVLKAIEELAELQIELGNILFSKDTRQRYSDGLLATCRIVTNASAIIDELDNTQEQKLDIDIIADGHHEADYKTICSEIADVRIMLQQLEMFLVKPEEVQEQIDFKVKRLEERINNE